MKRIMFFMLSVASLILVLATTGNKAKTASNNLPLQISEYYKNYNFVSAFSSPSERESIVNSLICNEAINPPNPNLSLHFCEGAEELPESGRLKKIRALMQELNEHTIRDYTNSAMVLPNVPSRTAKIDPEIFPPRGPYPISPYSIPSELVKVNLLRESDKAITVEVFVHPLTPETNSRLIAKYKKSADDEKKIPSIEKLIKVAPLHRQELHQWVRSDGQWMKSETEIRFGK